MISIPSAGVQSVRERRKGKGWNHNTDDEMTPNILWRAFLILYTFS